MLGAALALTRLESVPVRHCSDAYGIVLEHASGWSLAYSGDTQPCAALAAAGAGATLLIHEATFEPALAGQAAAKRHSTSEEALGVAAAMGAYRTLLTHFSQRYPKFPEGLLASEGAEGGGGTENPSLGGFGGSAGRAASAAVAFDGMCVPLSLLPLLPSLMPAGELALRPEEEAGAAAGAAGELEQAAAEEDGDPAGSASEGE